MFWILGSHASTVQIVAVIPMILNIAAAQDCPTGRSCGAIASYCQNYTAPSTAGGRSIKSLPYVIARPGNYYLNSDLSSTGNGIILKANNVDVNLNGHTITYGTVASGSGATAIGEYGILACNVGNRGSEDLDASYGANGACIAAGLSASNVTIENGSIVQSPNASQYYDPLNCPGSGIGTGSKGACSHHHETVASDVINMQYSSGITIRHMTLTWQNVDSDGIHLNWQQPGTGDVVECNTLNDKVTQINIRAYPRGMPIADMTVYPNQATATYQYNTIIGTPQLAIGLAKGVPAIVQYNDIDQGYYQAPPFTSELHGYSNDYALSCPRGQGTSIGYNYIHSVNGRGIGCIFQYDTDGTAMFGNYVATSEAAANGEYGPNGTVNGGSWAGGCEIDGGRGFEAKSSTGFSLYSNTFIVNVGACGGGGIVFVDYPCANCKNQASAPFNVHDNVIQILNTSGRRILLKPQPVACYVFDNVQGNYSNYFSPFLRDKCTSDGDYVVSDPYNPGNYLSFINSTWNRAGHPLSSGCGWGGGGCGHMMHWMGNATPPSDELGYVFQDVSTGNGATINFEGDIGTPVARGATVQWTYRVTVLNSGHPVADANVTAIDGGGQKALCKTDTSGTCAIVLRQENVVSRAGDATLTIASENPSVVSITALGCITLNYKLSITGTTREYRTLSCAPERD